MLRMSKLTLLVVALIFVSAFHVDANPVFVIGGKILKGDGLPLVNARVEVRNQTNLSLAAKEDTAGADGVYKILFVNLFDDVPISLGDVLQIQVFNLSNVIVATHTRAVTSLEVANRLVEANIQLFGTAEDIGKAIILAPFDAAHQVVSYSIFSQPVSGIISTFDSSSGQMMYSPVDALTNSPSH